MKKIIITIDGWSSCGKSTLAKQLARDLHYVYIDSGAMYRAITLYFLRNHVDWTNTAAVDEAMNHVRLEFMTNHKTGHTEIYLNGENVEYMIRDLDRRKGERGGGGQGRAGVCRGPAAGDGPT